MRKAVIFRVISFLLTLFAARAWFGDWHVSRFQIFLIFFNTGIYYSFDKAWEAIQCEKNQA